MLVLMLKYGRKSSARPTVDCWGLVKQLLLMLFLETPIFFFFNLTP
jgi:hypothetical protein